MAEDILNSEQQLLSAEQQPQEAVNETESDGIPPVVNVDTNQFPQKVKTYEVKGKVATVDPEAVGEFMATYPDAVEVLRFEVDGKKATVKPESAYEFLLKYPNAKSLNYDVSTPKKPQAPQQHLPTFQDNKQTVVPQQPQTEIKEPRKRTKSEIKNSFNLPEDGSLFTKPDSIYENINTTFQTPDGRTINLWDNKFGVSITTPDGITRPFNINEDMQSVPADQKGNLMRFIGIQQNVVKQNNERAKVYYQKLANEGNMTDDEKMQYAKIFGSQYLNNIQGDAYNNLQQSYSDLEKSLPYYIDKGLDTKWDKQKQKQFIQQIQEQDAIMGRTVYANPFDLKTTYETSRGRIRNSVEEYKKLHENLKTKKTEVEQEIQTLKAELRKWGNMPFETKGRDAKMIEINNKLNNAYSLVESITYTRGSVSKSIMDIENYINKPTKEGANAVWHELKNMDLSNFLLIGFATPLRDIPTYQIAKKKASGVPLTDDEEFALNLYQLNEMVKTSIPSTSSGNIVYALSETIPYMAGLGLTKGTGTMLKLGTEVLLKKMLPKFAMSNSINRAIGATVRATFQGAMLGSTVESAVNATIANPETNLWYNLLKEVPSAALSSMIEIRLVPLVSNLSKMTTKEIGSIYAQSLRKSVTGKIDDVVSSTLGSTEELVILNGLVGEFGEEKADQFKSILLGEDSWRNFFSLRNNLETFSVVALMQGGGKILKKGIQGADVLDSRKEYLKSMSQLPEQFKANIITALNQPTQQQQQEAFSKIPLEQVTNIEDRRKIVDFLNAKASYDFTKGALMGKQQLDVAEGTVQQAMEYAQGIENADGNIVLITDKETGKKYISKAFNPETGMHIAIPYDGSEIVALSETTVDIAETIPTIEFAQGIVQNKLEELKLAQQQQEAVQDMEDVQMASDVMQQQGGSYDVGDQVTINGKQATITGSNDGRGNFMVTIETPDGIGESVIANQAMFDSEVNEQPLPETEITAENQTTDNQEVSQEVAPSGDNVSTQPQSINTEATDVSTQPTPEIPRLKDGSPDFDNMQPEMLGVELEKQFGNDRAKSILLNQIKNQREALKRLDKKKAKTINEEAKNDTEKNKVKDNIKRLETSLMGITESNVPMMQKREQPKQKVVSNDIQQISEVYQSSPKVYGRSKQMTLPNGEKVKGRFVLIEAGSAVPSHDPFTFEKTKGFPTTETGTTVNDRDYEKDEKAQGEVILQSQKLDDRAYSNPVMITSDGIVVSGNQRTMTRIRAVQQGTDTDYTTPLREDIDMYGISQEQFDNLNNPQLVFELDETPDYTTDTFAKFNTEDKKSQSTTESAVKVSKTIKPDTISKIGDILDKYETLGEFYSDNQAIAEALTILQTDGVIRGNDVARLVKSDGVGLSDSGKEFFETLLIGSILNESAIRQIDVEGMRNVKQKIAKAIVPIVNNAKLKEYNLVAEISEAVNIVERARKNKLSVSNYISNGNIFDKNEYSDAGVFFAVLLDNSKESQFRNAIINYNTNAILAESGQMDIFSGEVTTKEQIVETLIQNADAETKQIQQKAWDAVKQNRDANAFFATGTTPTGSTDVTDVAETPTSTEATSEVKESVSNTDSTQEVGLINPERENDHEALKGWRESVLPDINNNPDIINLNAFVDKVRKLDPKDAMDKYQIDNGFNYEITISYPHSLGEQGIYTEYYYPEYPTVSEIKKDLLEDYPIQIKKLQGKELPYGGYAMGAKNENIVNELKKALEYNKPTTTQSISPTSETPTETKQRQKEVVADALGIESQRIAEVETMLNELSDKTKKQAKTTVVRSNADAIVRMKKDKVDTALIEAFQDVVAKGHKPEAIMTSHGLYIVSSNIKNTQRAVEVWMHEQAGHYGIRLIMPDATQRKAFFTDVYNSVGEANIRKELEEGYDKVTDKAKLGEEYFGRVCEKVVKQTSLNELEQGVWENFLNKLREFISNLLPSAKLSQGQIESIAKASIQNIIEVRQKTDIKARQKMADIEVKADSTNTNPTEAQKEAGNYEKGKVSIQGLQITIENPKGSVRSGTDKEGNDWFVEMNNHYGYFNGTKAKDWDKKLGKPDKIDVFIGDNPTSKKVFVVDQVDTETREFDESKVMLGFDTIEDAELNYLLNYEAGWQGLGKITEVDIDTFKTWLNDGKRQLKPFGEYKEFKKETPMFSIAKQDKNLLAIHNISTDGIKKAIKMGGLAQPSIAIINKNNPFTNFGEITLVMDKQTIDPKNRNVNVFGADVYSPRYPATTYTIPSISIAKINKYGESIKNEKIKDEFTNRIKNDIENNDGDRRLFNNGYLAVAFLDRNNIKFKTEYRKPSTDKRTLSDFKKSKVNKVFDWLNIYKDAELMSELESLYVKDMEYKYQKLPELLQEMKDELKTKDSDKKDNLLRYFYNGAKRDINEENKIDEYATFTNAKNKIKNSPKLEKEYRKDIESFYDSLNVEERIFKGFTNAGNRRYVPYTLENVLKEKKEEGIRAGENFGYGLPSIRAKATKQFRTLKEISESGKSIVKPEIFAESKKTMQEYLEKISELINPYYKFSRYDDNVLIDEVTALANRGRSESFDQLPEDVKKNVSDFYTALKEMPTEYFEAVISRVVDFSDFSHALVPKGTDVNIIEYLKKQGVNVMEYKKEERHKTLNKVAEESTDILFSIAPESIEDKLSRLTPLQRKQAEQSISGINKQIDENQTAINNLQKEIDKKRKSIDSRISQATQTSMFDEPTKDDYITTIADVFAPDLSQQRRAEVLKPMQKQLQALQTQYNDLVKQRRDKVNQAITQAKAQLEMDFDAMFSISPTKEYKPIPKPYYDKLLTRLNKAFPNVSISTDTAEMERVLSAVEGVQKLTTPTGELYGMTHMGKIYLDGNKMNANAPIHEYGHIWADIAQKQYPEVYNHGLELIKGTEYETAVRESGSYKGLSDEQIWNEALITAIGDRGERIVDKAIRNKFVSWLKDLFNNIRMRLGINRVADLSKFDLSKMDLSEFVKRVNLDLLGGVPISYMSSSDIAKRDADKLIIGIKGATRLDEINEATIRVDNLKVAEEMERGKVTNENIIDNTELNDGEKYYLRLTNNPSLDLKRKTSVHATGYDSIKQAKKSESDKDYVKIDNGGGIGELLDGLAGYELDSDNINDAIEEANSKLNSDANSTVFASRIPVIYKGEYKDDIPDGNVFSPNSISAYIGFDKVQESAIEYSEDIKEEILDLYRKQFSPTEIRLSTGWERGADNMWRYEVEDGKVNKDLYAKLLERKFDENIKSGLINAVSLKELYESEELYSVYPELENLQVIFYEDEKQTANASYDNAEKTIYLYNPLSLKTINGAESTLTHEIQHAIQSLENFAKGGSVDRFKQVRELNNDLLKEINKIDKALGFDDWFKENVGLIKNIPVSSPTLIQDMKVYYAENILDKKDKKMAQMYKDKMVKAYEIYDLNFKNIYGDKKPTFDDYKDYQRLAGEVEARNAQARMNFTPEQRILQTLASTEDISRADQIIIHDTVSDTPMFSIAPKDLKADTKMVTRTRDVVREVMQDRLLSVKMLQDYVVSKGGTLINATDTKAAVERYSSKVNGRFRIFEMQVLRPLTKFIANIEKTYNLDSYTTRDYLLAKASLARHNAGTDALSEDLNDEWNIEAVKKIITDYEIKVDASDIAELWDKTNAVNDFSMKALKDAGILTKEQYDNIKAKWDYYVPLRGWDLPDEVNKQIELYTEMDKQGIARTGDTTYSEALKKAKGRKSKAYDPISTMSNIAYSTLITAEKNIAEQSMLNFIRQNKDFIEDVAFVKRTWIVTSEDGKKEEEVLERPDQSLFDAGRVKNKRNKDTREFSKYVTPQSQQAKQIEVYENGIKYVIEFKQSGVAEAIRGTNMYKMPKVFDVTLGEATRFLSKNLTGLNPDFIPVNFVRDFGYAMLTNYVNANSKISNKSIINEMRQASKAIKAFSWSDNFDETNPLHKDFINFINNGGATGYVNMQKLEKVKKQIDRDLKVLAGSENKFEKSTRYVKAPFAQATRAIGFLGDMSELIMRYSVYRAGIKAGVSINESVDMAKNITVNFNRKGRISGVLGGLYAFYTASIQAGNNFATLAYQNKGKMAKVAGMFMAMGALWNIAMTMLMGGNPDDDESYYNVNEFSRYNNLIIPTGGKNYIKIPLPHVFRSFFAMGQIGVEMMTGQKSFTQGILGSMDAMLDGFSPVNLDLMALEGEYAGSTFMRTLLPTTIQPMWDLGFNRNFFGQTITRETFDKSTPKSQLGKANVSPVVRTMAETFNAWSGGDKFKSGVVDINPSAIEYLFESYTGGRGRFYLNLVKIGQSVFDKDIVLETKNIPIGNRFIGENRGKNWGAELKEMQSAIREDNDLMRKYYKNMDESKDFKQKYEAIAEKYDNDIVWTRGTSRNRPTPNLQAVKILDDHNKQSKLIYEDINSAESQVKKDRLYKVVSEMSKETVKKLRVYKIK